MALISNGVRLAQGNAGYMGGNASTSGAYNAERGVAWSPGARRLFAKGEARVSGVTNRAAMPEGYLHPTCWDMPQKSGGMASRGRIAGVGEMTAADLAGGLAALSNLNGTGIISSAQLGLILSALATLAGAGAFSANITGKLAAAAALAGAGNVAAALGAIAGLLVDLTGTGNATATTTGKAFISAEITVSGNVLTPTSIASAVWDSISEAGYSYADVIKILSAVAAGKTTITDNGNGTATVIFRNLADTVDKVTAEMNGSERTDIQTS